MCLALHVALFALGMLALVKGEIRLTFLGEVRGVPAYIAGGLLTFPFPATFLSDIFGGFLAPRMGIPPDASWVQPVYWVKETLGWPLAAACCLTAVVIAAMNAKPASTLPTPPPDETSPRKVRVMRTLNQDIRPGPDDRVHG
jgi:hypothetical protein